jgi:hypothetical protein
MPREIAIFDTFIPTIVPIYVVGAALTWLIDRLLAMTGLYRFVWHPALFRASLLACVCGLLGLAVYH